MCPHASLSPSLSLSLSLSLSSWLFLSLLWECTFMHFHEWSRDRILRAVSSFLMALFILDRSVDSSLSSLWWGCLCWCCWSWGWECPWGDRGWWWLELLEWSTVIDFCKTGRRWEEVLGVTFKISTFLTVFDEISGAFCIQLNRWTPVVCSFWSTSVSPYIRSLCRYKQTETVRPPRPQIAIKFSNGWYSTHVTGPLNGKSLYTWTASPVMESEREMLRHSQWAKGQKLIQISLWVFFNGTKDQKCILTCKSSCWTMNDREREISWATFFPFLYWSLLLFFACHCHTKEMSIDESMRGHLKRKRHRHIERGAKFDSRKYLFPQTFAVEIKRIT